MTAIMGYWWPLAVAVECVILMLAERAGRGDPAGNE